MTPRIVIRRYRAGFDDTTIYRDESEPGRVPTYKHKQAVNSKFRAKMGLNFRIDFAEILYDLEGNVAEIWLILPVFEDFNAIRGLIRHQRKFVAELFAECKLRLNACEIILVEEEMRDFCENIGCRHHDTCIKRFEGDNPDLDDCQWANRTVWYGSHIEMRKMEQRIKAHYGAELTIEQVIAVEDPNVPEDYDITIDVLVPASTEKGILPGIERDFFMSPPVCELLPYLAGNWEIEVNFNDVSIRR